MNETRRLAALCEIASPWQALKRFHGFGTPRGSDPRALIDSLARRINARAHMTLQFPAYLGPAIAGPLFWQVGADGVWLHGNLLCYADKTS